MVFWDVQTIETNTTVKHVRNMLAKTVYIMHNLCCSIHRTYKMICAYLCIAERQKHTHIYIFIYIYIYIYTFRFSSWCFEISKKKRWTGSAVYFKENCCYGHGLKAPPPIRWSGVAESQAQVAFKNNESKLVSSKSSVVSQANLWLPRTIGSSWPHHVPVEGSQ